MRSGPASLRRRFISTFLRHFGRPINCNKVPQVNLLALDPAVVCRPQSYTDSLGRHPADCLPMRMDVQVSDPRRTSLLNGMPPRQLSQEKESKATHLALVQHPPPNYPAENTGPPGGSGPPSQGTPDAGSPYAGPPGPPGLPPGMGSQGAGPPGPPGAPFGNGKAANAPATHDMGIWASCVGMSPVWPNQWMINPKVCKDVADGPFDGNITQF